MDEIKLSQDGFATDNPLLENARVAMKSFLVSELLWVSSNSVRGFLPLSDLLEK